MVRLEVTSTKVITAAGASSSRVCGSGHSPNAARARSTPYAMSKPPKPIASMARKVHIPVVPIVPPRVVDASTLPLPSTAIWLTLYR